jgi:hypothetical protein
VLDRVSYQRRALTDLPLEGWAVHPDWDISKLIVAQSGREQGETPVCLPRESVSRVFADWPGADRPGFRLVLPGPGTWTLFGEGKAGNREALAEIDLDDDRRQKLFFMHIAKAGGSSVNAYFSRQFAPDEARRHLESDPAWRSDPSSLEQRCFLSGHVNSVAIDRHLALEGFRRVTVLREPLEQLVSHLAWIRRLAAPGEEERYEAHPPYVRAFADKLAATDLSDSGALEALVAGLTREERGLVDNCQCRYLTDTVPDWVRAEHVPAAVERLKWFHHVGFVDRLEAFLAEVARAMAWPLPVRMGRENVTREFFGLASPSAGQIAALKPLTRHDEAILAVARRRFRQG